MIVARGGRRHRKGKRRMRSVAAGEKKNASIPKKEYRYH